MAMIRRERGQLATRCPGLESGAGFHHILWAVGPLRQDGILRPIVNRPFREWRFVARRPINNRPQDSILPHKYQEL